MTDTLFPGHDPATDPERESKLDAERVTAQFRLPLERPMREFLDSPLFGGDRQGELF